jgi:methyl-accepting chemotaxis protein
MIKVGIIGGGKGGTAILNEIKDLEDVFIMGIADVDEKASGIILAKSLGIKTFKNCVDLLNIPEVELIVEVTGNPKVLELIHANKKEGVSLIDANSAKLMMAIIKAKEETDEKLYIQAQNLAKTAENPTNTIKEIRNEIKEVANGAEELVERSTSLSSSAISAKDYAENINDVLIKSSKSDKSLRIKCCYRSSKSKGARERFCCSCR